MIVVDLETSGSDYREHSILSIGAVDFNNKNNTFYGECRIREGTLIDDEALKVNGFKKEYILNNEKSCEQLLKEFIGWCKNIKDITIAGHNVHFDWSFLRENFKIYNLEWIFGFRIVDLHSIFYFCFMKTNKNILLKDRLSGLGLSFILEYLNLGKREGCHNALEDAKLTAKAFSMILKKEFATVILHNKNV